ncbi:MAG: hypothetical protein JW742_06630, partial [Candidatus Aminicenantes bacterium]|nr:hypothetical protein [Candidatus Aminicenantes bacterium]
MRVIERRIITGVLVSVLALLMMIWSAPLSAQVQRGEAAANPVPNPSFEDVKDGVPVGWEQRNWQAKAEFGLEEGGRAGKTSARISSTDGADASWSAVVPITPFAKYRLSGWIKTKDLDPGLSRGALLNIHGMNVATRPLRGTQDWTRVDVEFDSGANDAVSVNCLFGGWGKATGAAWYDDIRLEMLSVRAMNPRAAIDA